MTFPGLRQTKRLGELGIMKFMAREKHAFDNGAIGYAPGGSFDCLGPYAKVEHCPVKLQGEENALFTINGEYVFVDTRVYATKRYTAYATGIADTFFSVPAATKIRGKHIGGFFTMDNGGCEFVAYDRFAQTILNS